MTPTQEALKADEFIKLNPRGRVPALQDGDFVVYESAAISFFLDQLHPEPPLYGTNAKETALTQQVILEVGC